MKIDYYIITVEGFDTRIETLIETYDLLLHYRLMGISYEVKRFGSLFNKPLPIPHELGFSMGESSNYHNNKIIVGSYVL